MSGKYQHTMKPLPQIQEMLASGMTQKEVEEALGFTGYRLVHARLKRERKKEQQGVPKQRARKPAKTFLAGEARNTPRSQNDSQRDEKIQFAICY